MTLQLFAHGTSPSNVASLSVLVSRYPVQPLRFTRPIYDPCVAALTYAICPWYLLATASVFITFLSSYQIFLSAIAGILICDYYLLRRGYLQIPALYSSSKDNPYRFLRGWNLRAFAAYLIAVAPNFYGFLNQIGVKAPMSIQKFYYVAYPTGLLIAFGCYYFFNLFFQPSGMDKTGGWKEPKDYVEFETTGQDIEIEGIPVTEVHLPGVGKEGENARKYV